MNQNHLILGLGGTGGKIIRAFRRSIYEEFRSKEPLIRKKDDTGRVNQSPHPVKLGYLYVDSDGALMAPDHPSWKIPGDTLQLGKANQLLIKGANLSGVLDNLGSYPNIAPWIGDRAVWRDILGSVVGEALGGQKRRLGRFLFACKANDSGEGFLGKLRNQVEDLRRRSGENAVTFHVCAGLAGGTGSGCVIDVVTQIRRLYPEEEHRIVLYSLLPETQPPQNWDTGNYHANGYAALVELNALAVGAFHPHDVAEGSGRVSLRDASGTPVAPFNGSYIFTTENENGRVLNLERDEASSLLASFLFQKIVVAHATPWADVLRRSENAENGDGSPESLPGGNIPQRSKRFLTFGIKRLIIPEEEIREFITYSFARQAVLHLQFNNWSATQGYVDLPRNEPFAQFVADPRNHERWRMGDGYLCLEHGILPAEERENWRSVEEEWKASINGFLQVAMKSEDALWMSKLTQLVENHYTANWRTKGVADFFRLKEGDVRDQAREIRKRLEADLWGRWSTGEWSMFDVGRVLSELHQQLEEKLETCDRNITKFRAMVEDGKARSELSTKIRENNVTWAKIGPLSAAFGKRKSILQAQAECFKDYYAARHRIEAWAYAHKLLQQVLEEVADLSQTVQANISVFTELVEGDTSASSENRFVGLLERIEARCAETLNQDLKDQVVKLYDPKLVRAFSQRLVRDEEIQRTHTKAVRDAICERLGERADFSTFRQKLLRGVLLDLMEKVCGEQAEQAHNSLLASDPNFQRILGANIADSLSRTFSGNSLQLKEHIRSLVSSAGNYLRMDPMEEKRTGPGAGPVSTRFEFAVLIPDASEHPDFIPQLEQAFRDASTMEPSFFTNPKATEIVMIGIRNLFPLRYARPVAFLQEKHQARLLKEPKARIEAYSEGDGTGWPPVFLPNPADIRKGLFAWILLGQAIGCVRLLDDPSTGVRALYLIGMDERGREQTPVHIGSSEESIVESGDPSSAYRLETTVRSRLQTDYLHKEKREELIASLDTRLKQVQQQIPNALDRKRESFQNALMAAEAILSQVN